MKGLPTPQDERPGLTPLVDIAFLILIFFMALPVKRLDGKLAMHLPTTYGQIPLPAEPPPKVTIRVREGPLYLLGQHRANRAWDLAPLIRKLGPQNIYEIDATPQVDYASVVSLVDLLAAEQCLRVQVTGARREKRTKDGS